ncbi:importin-5-like [Anaeramoeba flamelloides]|uniref:Importin-5-like n=1 Tax=Anaeramoeba flamelloides TaxID=1746091 RepID=A0AAV7Y7D4_9EUKA|nr:importin-5-like [Anaeramoeba flamelloides]
MTEEDFNKFDKLIGSLLVTDNNERFSSEKEFQELLFQDPDLICNYLLQTSVDGSNFNIQTLSLIILWNTILPGNYFVWEKYSQNQKQKLQDQLLQFIFNIHDKYLLKRVCDLIQVIAQKNLPQGKWPELIPFIINLAEKEESLLIEINMYLIKELMSSLYVYFVDEFETFKDIFYHFLNLEYSPLPVRLSTIKATTSFLIKIKDENDIKQLKDLINPILTTI